MSDFFIARLMARKAVPWQRKAWVVLSLFINLGLLSHEEKQLTAGDSIADIIDNVTEKNIQVLYDSRHILDARTVEQCVALLRRSRSILLFGVGASLCAAKDAYLKFLRLNKPCIVNEDWHSQLLQARNATGEDVAIIFSYSGQTQEMVTCMKELKENGFYELLPIRLEQHFAPFYIEFRPAFPVPISDS